MPFLKLLTALLLPSLNGYLIVCLFVRDDKEAGFFEKVFLGYGLGLGVLTIIMFIMGMLGITYNFLTLTLSQLVLLVVFSWQRLHFIKNPLPMFKNNGPKIPRGLALFFTTVAIIWIGAKILFVFHRGLAVPLQSWDTWTNWSAGAKFFYYRKGLVLDRLDEHFFGRGYRLYMGHPLLSSLVQVWIAVWEGEFHEVLVKAWAPFYFLSILGLFFIAVRRETSFMTAMLSTLLLSGVPILTFHATEGYSDVPMAYYAFASTLSFWRYLKTGRYNWLYLSGIFAGIGIFTKNEGLFLALAIGLAITFFVLSNKGTPKYIPVIFLLVAALAAGPWIFFKAFYNLDYGHGIEQKFIGVGSTLYALKVFAKALFLGADFNLVFAFLLLVTLLDWKNVLKDDIRYLFVILVIPMAAFFSVYVSSSREFEESLVTGFAVNRNILTCIPIAYFIAALKGYKIINNSQNKAATAQT